MLGYIYVRNHLSYINYNCVKLGQTLNILDRDNMYKTGEVEKGYFELVIEMSAAKIETIEKLLKNYFSHYHIKKDGGSEFYDIKILDEIVDTLKETFLDFKVLTVDEINTLMTTPIKNYYSNCYSKEYNPRNYQVEIINKSITFYETNDSGILVLPCGVGKTLISLFIALELNCSKISICVPSTLIANQWKDYSLNLFPSAKILIIDGSTSIYVVNLFFNNLKPYDECIVILTYYSIHKLLDIKNKNNIDFKFDVNIIDEIHHLHSLDSKKYINVFCIKSNKKLGLTATLPITNEHMGKVIEKHNLKWGIDNKIICDYRIKIYNILELNFENTRYYICAYITLENMLNNNINHTIIYTNTIEKSKQIQYYINLLINDKSNIFYSDLYKTLFYTEYNTDITGNSKCEILKNFKTSPKGILISIYSLGEGVNLPIVDSVVFSEMMVSQIRIIQSALRAGRKNINDPFKITKIIIPIFNNDNVNNILTHLYNEDEDLYSKIETLNFDKDVNVESFELYSEDRDEEDINFEGISNINKNAHNILKEFKTKILNKNIIMNEDLEDYLKSNYKTLLNYFNFLNLKDDDDCEELQIINQFCKILELDVKILTYTLHSRNFIEKLTPYIISTFEKIKEVFKWKSDSFLAKKTFQNTINIINRIFKFIGIEFIGTKLRGSNSYRHYTTTFNYTNPNFKTLLEYLI